MNQKNIPTIGITMGDPAGIGPELVARSLSFFSDHKDTRFVVYGSNALLTIAADACGLHALRWHRVDANSPRANSPIHQHITVFDGGEEHLHELKPRPSVEGGLASKRWVEQAITDAMLPDEHPRHVDAVVTAPICKESWFEAGYRWAGHTELFATRTKSKRHAMAFISPTLKVVLATCHIPLMDIRNVLTIGKVFDAIDLANDSCVQLGIAQPRIAVAGLNPHAGENGLLGDEEKRLIEPAMHVAREAGIDVQGPYPADTLFTAAREGAFDMIVAMYHDQGLLPVKLLHTHQAVNWTLGLPIIRTSPDHGTAFDKAKKFCANDGSMLASMQLAVHLSKTSLPRPC
ncbi:MAG: 4-hydroxythreonine-4-phosphate dehydrogenase PdxA [Phycisphaerales bacterium]|jgi:4-hydroxythreonine-4-phosphate dehydrogenase|nr:4-hydroxythreonine-4-phosphate dehydrogenase PdxA [Phycisphaerales bacterium]